jgi:hypothetical protein
MDLPCVDLSRPTDWRKFYDLDYIYSPGLTEEEFLGLFVKCSSCALITMHQRFKNHHCSMKTSDGVNE